MPDSLVALAAVRPLVEALAVLPVCRGAHLSHLLPAHVLENSLGKNGRNVGDPAGWAEEGLAALVAPAVVKEVIGTASVAHQQEAVRPAVYLLHLQRNLLCQGVKPLHRAHQHHFLDLSTAFGAVRARHCVA